MKYVYIILLSIIIMELQGCASYSPKPLKQEKPLADIRNLEIPVENIRINHLKPHKFDPEDGFDIIEIATIALVNNPNLKVVRNDIKIAEAQLFETGLIPDPQISMSIDHPINVGSSYKNAFNAGINYDLRWLITRSTSIKISENNLKKINLNVLWQEWQTVQQAKLLFIKIITKEELLEYLKSYRVVINRLSQIDTKALDAGNIRLDTALANYYLLENLDSKIKSLERDIDKDRKELNILLGIDTNLELNLKNNLTIPNFNWEKIKQSSKQISERRPDLLALKFGYDAQENRLRLSILEQFPAFSISLTNASDTSGIKTVGFSISITLPIFNRNQGKIKIEEATRDKLYDEYQARLISSYGQIESIVNQLKLSIDRYDQVNKTIEDMITKLNIAESALNRGNLDLQSYVNLYILALDRYIEINSLKQYILESCIALELLLSDSLCTQN